MKKSSSRTGCAVLPLALLVIVIGLTAKTIMDWQNSPAWSGAEKQAKLGSAVLFQPKENTVRAEFDNEIRIVVIPPMHCVTYKPEAAVDVLKQAERTLRVLVRHKATITFQKVPLTDPKCQG